METTVGGALVLATLTIAIVVIANFMVTSSRETGFAIRESVELVGEQTRSSLTSESKASSTGKYLGILLRNTGINPISKYEDMDVIVKYKSNKTGEMVYKRLKYTSSTPKANEWVDRTRIPDTLQKGIWDSTESLEILANLLPRQHNNSTGTINVSLSTGTGTTLTFNRAAWMKLADTPVNVTRGGHLSTDGTNIYSVLGSGTDALWLYLPINETTNPQNIWQYITSTPTVMYDGTSLQYAEENGDQYLYLMAGGSSTSFWRFDLTNGIWDTSLASVPDSLGFGASMVWDTSDTLYILQGGNTKNFWQYSISNDTWSTSVADTISTVHSGGSLSYVNGEIYALRGNNTSDFWCFCNNSWISKPNAPGEVGFGGALAWDQSDYIYAWPGRETDVFWRFKISSSSWEELGNYGVPRVVDEGGYMIYLKGDLYGLMGDGSKDLWSFQPQGY